MSRRFLVWISCGPAGPASSLFDSTAEYDVFYHNYSGQPTDRIFDLKSRFLVERPGEKLQVAGHELVVYNTSEYEAVAFLDDDLSFDTATLNRCFHTGVQFGLDIWQPALTLGSF